MKLYKTTSHTVIPTSSTHAHYETKHYAEWTSSAGDASKVRTRLNKIKGEDGLREHEDVTTTEVEVDNTRTGLIKFLNEMMAHESWVVAPVTKAVQS